MILFFPLIIFWVCRDVSRVLLDRERGNEGIERKIFALKNECVYEYIFKKTPAMECVLMRYQKRFHSPGPALMSPRVSCTEPASSFCSLSWVAMAFLLSTI